MNRFLFFAALGLFVGTAGADEDAWRSRLRPSGPGAFPIVRPFVGEFRFGWSGIEAAQAKAKVTRKGDEMRFIIEGGTMGMARTLWQITARHNAVLLASGLRPVSFVQMEKYANRAVHTQAVFKPDGLWRKRQVIPDPGKTPRWKKIKVEPIRDIVSAMLFIRSQKLANGDKVGVIAFPGDAPFLVEAEVLKREKISVAGRSREAIKLEFRLQRIVLDDKKVRLESHKKFRSGTVWLSDDSDRIPLRAEVNIFIGYVFGELVDVSFGNPEP